MSDKDQKIIFRDNLNQLLRERNKTQIEVAESIGVSPQTFNTWTQGIAIPRMDKIQLLADYFHVTKSYLVDPPEQHSKLEGINALLAAHFEGDKFTEEELLEIEKFIQYVESKRNI